MCSGNEWGELLSCDDPEETYDYVINDNDDEFNNDASV